jgi:hypothetical protein
MDMLAKAAERDELSISQKAEQLLLAGLRAEDAFERAVAAPIEAFRDAAQRAVAANGGRSPDEDAEVARLVREAARKLLASFPDLMVSTDQAIPEAARRHVRVGRQLLVDDTPEGED